MTGNASAEHKLPSRLGTCRLRMHMIYCCRTQHSRPNLLETILSKHHFTITNCHFKSIKFPKILHVFLKFSNIAHLFERAVPTKMAITWYNYMKSHNFVWFSGRLLDVLTFQNVVHGIP